MFAIVEASGRQFQLEAGRFVDVDLTEGKEGDKFVFEHVLMLVDGDKSTVGKPFIEGAKVEGKILGHDKNKKIIVYHMKPKKGTRKKQGHRQHYTRILIESIKLNDKELAKADDQARAKKAEPKKAAKAEPKAKAEAKPKADAKTAAKKKSAE